MMVTVDRPCQPQVRPVNLFRIRQPPARRNAHCSDRDFSYQAQSRCYVEYVIVAASSIAPLPKTTDLIAFGTIGLAAATAYGGLQKLGTLPGKTLIVTGSTGGVGSLAVMLGRAASAHVVE